MSFKEYEELVQRETGEEGEREAFEKAGGTVEGASQLVGREEGEVTLGEESLERKMERTLYFLVKKDRKDHPWGFRESARFSSLLGLPLLPH